MFILRGEAESEACLVEVECKAANLRSGAAFVFVDSEVRRGGYTQYDEHGTVTMGRYQDPRVSTGTLDVKFLARWGTFCIPCLV